MSPNFYQKSEVLYKLGMIFAKTNQIQQAISYFQNSILTSTFTLKRKTDTLIKIGMLYEEQKDYVQAMREYEAAIIGDKSNYKIYQHLAWCSFQMGKINKAFENIAIVEQLNPGQADTLYIQGRCYMALDDNKKALELLQEAAFKYPGEAAYWATLAIVYYKNGDYSDSFENIIKATSLNTFKSEIWYNLGILYEKCKQPEEALIAYSKVQDLVPGDEDSLKRINIIQSPHYTSHNGQNQSIFNLQMKQPVFTLPNSLTILKKYKKQYGNKDDNKELGGDIQGLLMLSQNGGNQNNLVLPSSGVQREQNLT
jgi:tetratricopeptide (TPR) repeat protein